ncbi:hypothetical protein [Salinicoccus luteus]|uniref:hypothetical protein n=1 Tax=Salinicoccus luteus TaxID=367840 RepID=UPI0004E27CDD|nr:hypothetical protein [Salinicoccus luteus]
MVFCNPNDTPHLREVIIIPRYKPEEKVRGVIGFDVNIKEGEIERSKDREKIKAIYKDFQKVEGMGTIFNIVEVEKVMDIIKTSSHDIIVILNDEISTEKMSIRFILKSNESVYELLNSALKTLEQKYSKKDGKLEIEVPEKGNSFAYLSYTEKNKIETDNPLEILEVTKQKKSFQGNIVLSFILLAIGFLFIYFLSQKILIIHIFPEDILWDMYLALISGLFGYSVPTIIKYIVFRVKREETIYTFNIPKLDVLKITSTPLQEDKQLDIPEEE